MQDNISKYDALYTASGMNENADNVQEYILNELQNRNTRITENHFAQSGLKLYESGALHWTTREDKKPDTVELYFLNYLPYYLIKVNNIDKAAEVLSDFSFLMKRLRYGSVERVVLDYILFRDKLSGYSPICDAFLDVIVSKSHYLRRNSEENPAYKTMLQIATEVADNCPVTQAAERWLNPENGASPCDWFWINNINRPIEYQPNPCKLVIENSGAYAKLLSNGDILIWGDAKNVNANKLYIYDSLTGVCNAVLNGHTDVVESALELKSGDILSWSYDKTLRLWSPDGVCKAIMNGHADTIFNVLELRSGDILSWSKGADYNIRLWSPDGVCKAVMNGHTDSIQDVLELQSGNILTCSRDKTLRLWFPDGTLKAVMEETYRIKSAFELKSGDILSWTHDLDCPLRLWSSEGVCKATLDVQHADIVRGVLELKSGDILSWSKFGKLSIWSADGQFKTDYQMPDNPIGGVIELQSGDILSWSSKASFESDLNDDEFITNLYIWRQDGTYTAVTLGCANTFYGAFELKSGDILYWSDRQTMHIYSPDGTLKAKLDEDIYLIHDPVELQSGNILLWNEAAPLLFYSPDGVRKAVMEGHIDVINGLAELPSGDLITYGDDNTICIWSTTFDNEVRPPKYTNNDRRFAELQMEDSLWRKKDRRLSIWSNITNGFIYISFWKEKAFDLVRMVKLQSDSILTMNVNKTICLWNPSGIQIKEINPENPQYNSFNDIFINCTVRGPFQLKKNNGTIDLQHENQTLIRWNTDVLRKCYHRRLRDCQFLDDNIYVWYDSYVGMLQLNFGNHIGVSFEDAQKFLNGEVDESGLVTHFPELNCE